MLIENILDMETVKSFRGNSGDFESIACLAFGLSGTRLVLRTSLQFL